MKTGWKIGIMAITGIGIGTWAKLKLYPDTPCACDQVSQGGNKVMGQTGQDSFSPQELRSLKSSLAPDLLGKEQRFLRDLAQWGTQEGIIEVSDLLDTEKLLLKLKAIQQGKLKALGTPSHLKKLDQYILDLEKWGTRQGIIEVSNDEHAAKKKRDRLQKMAMQGKAIAHRHLAFKRKQYTEQGKKVRDQKDVLDLLKKDFELTQVTFRNTSSEERTLTLWEANRATSISPPKSTDVEDHSAINSLVVGDAVHPQGMAVNPKNQLTYITNQLSNNVSIVGTEGQLIKLVQLTPAVFPGLNSPVAVAINTSPEHVYYGFAYVVGSVANTVSIINLDFEVIAVIPVGIRPLAIVYNPIQDSIVVSNYVENTVSVIDASSFVVETLAVGKNPLGMGVHTQSGSVYIANSATDSISVLSFSNTVSVIDGLGFAPSKIAYHPSTQEMYVVSTATNQVALLDADNQILEKIPVNASPYEIIYNQNNDFMYVANRTDNQITVIAPDKTIKAILDFAELNNGFAINQSKNLLFTAASDTGFINIIGYQGESSAISIDEDFEEKSIDFQHNPVVIKHAKFVLSGTERFKTLKLRTANAAGNSSVKTVSFSEYASPQNIQNVSEVHGLKGAVIDGSTGWQLSLAPNQILTILLYYQQFDRYSLLPETSKKSLGVTMSKGVAKNLSDPKRKYNPII